MSRAYLSFAGISYKLCTVLEVETTERGRDVAGCSSLPRKSWNQTTRVVHTNASHFHTRSSSHGRVRLAVMPLVVQMIPFSPGTGT
jgi:hypothetical protein